MPSAVITPITPPRVPLIDARTGQIDRAWYMFFLSLLNAATTVYENVDLGPSPISLISTYDAALQALAQDVGTLPIPADLSVELAKQIDAAGITDTGLLSMVAEMQKQIDALNAAPPILPSSITNGAAILYGDNLGGFSNATIGSGISFSSGTLSATGSGGTVTSVSVVSANGLAGTVATATTTPEITLSTSITGLLKGNGTAISAAVVNTDYIAPSVPVTQTADFTVAATDVWLINNKSGSTCTVTLPAAASWSGRILRFQNYQTQTLVSATSNVVPLAGGAASTPILLASAGDSATLVSNGTNWLMTQYTPNNILLLE